MPSGKARFRGNEAWKKRDKPFSDNLGIRLRELCPIEDADADIRFAGASDADRFVDEVLMAASWALDELDEVKAAITKSDLVAEHKNAQAQLQRSLDKLQSLSPELDRLLGAQSNNHATCDAIALLLNDFQIAADRLKLPSKQLNKQLRSKAELAIAEEMAVRVIQTAEPYGVVVKLTDGAAFGSPPSLCLRMLKLIGDDVGLKRTLTTWRRIVSKAKKNNPQL